MKEIFEKSVLKIKEKYIEQTKSIMKESNNKKVGATPGEIANAYINYKII